MLIESSVREHLLPWSLRGGCKSKKIERLGGLKNCQLNKAEQKGCQVTSIQPCAIFKSDITL